MTYSIGQLQSDVMARLGEIARPQASVSESGILWPEDVVAMRIASLLPEVGADILRKSPEDKLGGGVEIEAEDVSLRLMPCGLYAADIRLPDDFVRLVSVKMTGWERSAIRMVLPDDAEWARQWSSEAGIAGSRERPRAYLSVDRDGWLLRAVGCDAPADSLEWLRGWRTPGRDSFAFPEVLYGDLVGAIAVRLS